MSALFCGKFVIIYLGLVMPWEERHKNYLEIINEYILLILMYHCILFTEFFADYEIRYNYIGVSFLIFVIISILMNSLIVITA